MSQSFHFFGFSITGVSHALGYSAPPFIWFYPVFFQQSNLEEPLSLKGLQPLFVMYLPEIEKLGEIKFVAAELVQDIPAQENQSVQIQFDPSKSAFIAAIAAPAGTEIRPATLAETMAYCDYFACQVLDLQALKLRLLETSLGFIPSFQYKVEQTYRQFFAPKIQGWKEEKGEFPKADRKQIFEKAFSKQIIPLAQQFGFSRQTKTSYRLERDFGNGLSAIIYFEFLTFGYGGYSVQVYYYEKSFGSSEEGQYFAQLLPHFPHSTNIAIDARNAEMLQWEIAEWVRTAELYLFPFLERHSTHAQLLANVRAMEQLMKIRAEWGMDPLHRKPAYYFEFPGNRREACLAVLGEDRS